MDLNSQLDEQLAMRGQKIARAPTSARQLGSADQIARKNDALRKRNNELQSLVFQAASLQRVQELQSAVLLKSKERDQLVEENRSLENVYANQMAKLGQTQKVEDDIQRAKSTAQEEIRAIKDRAKDLKEIKDESVKELKAMQRRQDALEGKIKVQDQIGVSLTPLRDLQAQLAEKERIIEALKYQVAVLSRTNLADKRRVKARTAKASKDVAGVHVAVPEGSRPRSLSRELGVGDF